VHACSAVGGPLLGGWLTDNASWRIALVVSLPLAVAALLLPDTRLRERFEASPAPAGAR
jgi:MFS family permease